MELGGALSAPRNNSGGHKRKRRDSTAASTTIFEGTSTALEKPYLRLTAAPRAADVRPLRILRKALKHVKAEFLRTEDFGFANEQLKSKWS